MLSLRKLASWYDWINQTYWLGRLPEVELSVEPLGSVLAYCYGDSIVFNKDADWAFDLVVSTVAHESIHVWQDNTGRKMDHGPSFQAHAKRLRALLGVPVA